MELDALRPSNFFRLLMLYFSLTTRRRREKKVGTERSGRRREWKGSHETFKSHSSGARETLGIPHTADVERLLLLLLAAPIL